MSDRVLVTGGSGFIGTWVLHELIAQGDRPVVVDVKPAHERWQALLGDEASQVEWAGVSLLDCEGLEETIRQHGISHIIHLAAMLTPDCQQNPLEGCRVNVLGSTSVFEAARRSERVRSISYASSYAVYGEAVAEDASDTGPPTFYGAFKLAVDQIAEQYWRHFGIASIAVRPHVVYGPLREVGLTAGPSLAARAAACGEPYCIGYTGQVCYDYVADVARSFLRGAFECPDGASVVDLPGEPATTDEFAAAIVDAVPEAAGLITVDGPRIPSNIPPAPNYINTLFTDWAPTPLREGVRRTVEFYRQSAGL